MAALAAASPPVVHPARAQTPPPQAESEIYRTFQDITRLRAEGRYGDAVARLTAIVQDSTATDAVLIQAYNHLVTTYHEQGDMEGARRAAREALQRFPGITADEVMFPPRVNEYYADLRREMFGSLRVVRPEGCSVFLDGRHVGDVADSPLVLEYVPVGAHEITLTKPGHHDYVESVAIEPASVLEKTVSLDRTRDKTWWAWRIGAGAVVAGVVTYALTAGGNGGSVTPLEPLPGPPAPPTQ